MPDLPVEPGAGGRYPDDMQTRVALLEQIVQTNAATFARFERLFEAQRGDLRAQSDQQRSDFRALSDQQRADFRWLLGIMLGGFGALLGVMAHGFHWL